MNDAVLRKVIAYITYENYLLVFSHTQHPEAGIQVPAGTVEPDESPQEAVLREAREETGLEELRIRSFLGTREVDRREFGGVGIEERYFFHLEYLGKSPQRWRHFEMDPSEGPPGPIEFEFFWVRFPEEVPELIGGQGEMFQKLQMLSD
ncbi:MAG: NUDIX domain-containing protein [Anaerolineales bacterium]|nr:NUDIX domain-containing protein [Anaerolineales bacterium]